jgi:predicted DNA binding CopG/RHH family protein
MYKGLTEKEIKIAKHYENMTEAEADAEHEWAKTNGLSFSGPGALSKAIAAAKTRSAESKARMVSIRMDCEDIEGIKAKAARMGVNYQTLIKTLVHRYLNGTVTFSELF